MMAAPTGVFVMRDAIVTIDTVEYANQCTKARLVPDTPSQTLRTLVPDGIVVDTDSTAWTFELAGVQTFDATGLAKALHDKAGQQINVTLQPKAGSGQDTATFTAVAMPVEFGGEQGQFRTFDTTLNVVGAPTISQSV